MVSTHLNSFVVSPKNDVFVPSERRLVLGMFEGRVRCVCMHLREPQHVLCDQQRERGLRKKLRLFLVTETLG